MSSFCSCGLGIRLPISTSRCERRRAASASFCSAAINSDFAFSTGQHHTLQARQRKGNCPSTVKAGPLLRSSRKRDSRGLRMTKRKRYEHRSAAVSAAVPRVSRPGPLPARCRRYNRRRGHTSTSSLREKCSSGGTSGRVMPAALAMVLTSISASASCSGQGTWWISARKVLRPVVV